VNYGSGWILWSLKELALKYCNDIIDRADDTFKSQIKGHRVNPVEYWTTNGKTLHRTEKLKD